MVIVVPETFGQDKEGVKHKISWTSTVLQIVVCNTYPCTVLPLPVCWLVPGCAVILVILSVVLCLWNVYERR
jgi:hypothetical protein